jgi:precorrin-6A synthase
VPPSRTILAVGIGSGDPEQVTVQAVKALNRADVFFELEKRAGTEDLVALRHAICERYVEDPSYRVVTVADPPRDLSGRSYGQDIAAWHEARATLYESLLRDSLADGEVGAFLVWGDPAVYDSTLRILDQVAARGTVDFTVEVIPGISSIQALAAAHRIALHGVGRPLHVTTGRRLAADGWPPGVDDLVIMLDRDCTFTTVDPAGVTIYWGAYLGTPDEILIAGPLADVAAEIEKVRAEARARKGWMFDTYLLRRGARGAR